MAKKRISRKTSQKVGHPRLTPSDSATDQPLPFPIVGIGASAGGLEAFEIFFAHLPPESGMAFVIVQHLDPTHKSILSELLKKHTSMSVAQVKDGMSVEPNAVYVIPPNSEMTLQGRELKLTQPSKKRGLRLPIDVFFRSLADQQKEQAVCIILSGTGTDGTLGMKAIKEAGGLAIVQAPESARYDGMPTSAINTGLADVILPVDQIAGQLIRYVRLYVGRKLLSTQNDKPEIIDHLQKIFARLRANTGHDFSGYKENTILRRIVELEDELRATHEYLQTTVEELETTNEELKSAVEELQSSNEELQSANEELQTSKEELQSINEELVTVNAELQANIEELIRANTDIKNLLDNIQVGVLFLDMNLRIRRFTPSAVEIVDLIPADIGRPLAQLVHKLQHDRLIQETRETLDTLVAKEFEVRSRDGNWYLVRILPYYTLEQQVDGVVLTITDITELKNAEQRLRESETLFRTLAEYYPNVYLSIIEKDMTVGYTAGLEFKKQGWDPEQFKGMSLEQVFGDQAEVVRAHFQQAFAGVPQEFELFINDQYQLYRVAPLPAGDNMIPRILSVVENITERRQAEKALADGLSQYRILVESSHDGIIHNDVDGNIISINSKFAELFGFDSVDEIMQGGITTFDLIAPEEKDTVQERSAPILEYDQARNVEMKVRRKDGSHFEAEFNTTMIRDNDGKPAKMVTYVRDITERKQAVAERQRLLKVLEASLNELYMFDPETLRFQYVNEGAIRNLGYSFEQLKTMTPIDLKPEFTETKFRELMEPLLQHQQEKLVFQTVHRRSDGSLYPVEVHLQLVENSNQRVFLAVILDITERKQAEDALLESEEKARVLLNAIPDLLFRLNREGVFLDYKAEQGDLYTRSTEIIGKRNHDLTPPDFADLIDRQIQATLSTGEMQVFEYQLPIPERGLRDYEARMFHSGVDEVTAIVRDMTEQKQAEEASRESQQLLQEIINNTPALIYIFDTDNRVVLLNNEIEKLLGLPSHQLTGKTRYEVLPKAVATQHRDNDLEVIRSQSPKTFVEENHEADGTHYYLTTKFPLFDAKHEVYAVCGISVDITERKHSEEELLKTTKQLSLRLAEIEQLQDKLQEQAIRDPLTGLHNRRYMSETLERELSRAEREQMHLSVIVSDIDKFKAINDTHGHKLGDEFLVQIAAMLKKHIRGSDIACRYGGEEFVLVLTNTGLDSAIRRAEEIRQKCQNLVLQHEGYDLSVTISFGVAAFPIHGKEAEELIIKADKAMYRAKDKGGNLVEAWNDTPGN